MNSAFAASPVITTTHYQNRLPHTLINHRTVHRTPRTIPWKSALVAVAGATGGVGRLVINRLLQSILPEPIPTQTSLQHIHVTAVRALVRNEANAKQVLPQHHKALTFHPINTAEQYQLQQAMKDVQVLIICTGTTAFPTRAWRYGNTPTAVDDRGVKNLVSAVDHTTIKRVVLLSSIGTHRVSQFPFMILNTFGVMDAKRRGEAHVQRAARRYGFSYAIVRVGRLVGAPHTNIGMVRKDPHPRFLDVEIARGDSLAGELSRSAAADAVFIAAKWDTSADLNISLVHREGPSPMIERWESLLEKAEIKRRVDRQEVG